jgi:mannosyl-oligosaccharide alpha-1,2-mannosidase
MGATIVDSLDTLYIMGLMDEFNEAREFVSKLDVNVDRMISFFETTIRMVGGLLSAHALSGDSVFAEKAQELADRLMPAFDTPSKLPRTTINPRTGVSTNPSWTGGRGVLAEMGTVQLEYSHLNCITGNSVYEQKSMSVYTLLNSLPLSRPGLYPVFVQTENRSPSFGNSQITLGALGDSYYEYLLKVSLYRDDYEVRQMWETAASAIASQLVQQDEDGHIYIAEMTPDGTLHHKMDHLACFAAGMFMLGADGRHEYSQLALALADTCAAMYDTPTGIGPEVAEFHTGHLVSAGGAKHYLLRPEAIEAWFYMWRYTHDQHWRDVAWNAFQAIEKECRTEHGYSGIRDVMRVGSAKDDSQQSFFLAETLKYFYLIFEDDGVVPLDQYIFNTEAHPLPAKCYAK